MRYKKSPSVALPSLAAAVLLLACSLPAHAQANGSTSRNRPKTWDPNAVLRIESFVRSQPMSNASSSHHA